jgi:excisionase family DNA binding protein
MKLPEILTLEQAADYLQISPEVLDAELSKGLIPGKKFGGKWRIRKEAIDQYLSGSGKSDEHIIADPTVQEKNLEPIVMEGSDQEVTEVEESSQEDAPAEKPSPKSDTPTNANPELPEIPPGKMRATVFAYNPKEGYGYARLADNRVVWLEDKNLLKPSPRPFPGDILHIEIFPSRKKGLEARAIEIVRYWNQVKAAQQEKKVTVAVQEAGSEESSDTANLPIFMKPASNTSVSTNGTPKAQKIYQKAALARAEGKYSEAKQLFYKAIDAGGGTQVYTAFFKMLTEPKGSQAEARRIIPEARRIIQQAIKFFPTYASFYDMYGHMERRAGNSDRAEKIFRQGLLHAPNNTSLRFSLGRILVQIGSENNLKEAGEIFKKLEKEGKLNKSDGLYQRFMALQRNERVSHTYDFFRSIKMYIYIAGRTQSNIPSYATDVVTEIKNQELIESFGLSETRGVLIRCFHRAPTQLDVLNLSKFLEELGSQGIVGLQIGREVVLDSSLAFIAVPRTESIRDQIMNLLSEKNVAIVPLDDGDFQASDDPDKAFRILRELLSQYLGQRDLYNSTMPVSGRRFFGREQLLLQLTDDVHQGQFIGIYGLRKTGKTSLIYQLRDEQLRGDAVAYVDLQSSLVHMVKNCSPLYWELERDLYKRLINNDSAAAKMLRLGPIERFTDIPDKTETGVIFSEDIQNYLDYLKENSSADSRRLVIILDELERILPVAGQPGVEGYLEFFALLRGLAQTERYRGLFSSVVVAANAAISERGYWEGRENPVFALYKPVFLPPLNDAECIEMIKSLGKGMSVYWEEQAIKTVLREAGGHPFLTRILCSRIARSSLTRPLTVAMDLVEQQIAAFIRDESDKLDQITELLHRNFPEEEAFLRQIALGNGVVSTNDESLRHLLGYHLIEERANEYHITLNLLKRWLLRQVGIKEQ